MDRKGANTFPFYNLPPVLRNISKKVFSVLFPFPLLDEIKVGGDSCLPRHFANKKHKPVLTVGSATISKGEPQELKIEYQ